MAPDILIRPLHTLDEFHRCVAIAREIWGDADLETEPPVTFVIAHHTGGQILGAFDGDLMVGFTKALIGIHDHTPYLHSHMAGVLPSHRDRHIGRQLKLFQREDALRRNIRLIEWTFDPLETKNAHFNLNRLGALCRTYIPNFYGITTSPLHRGMPTDRLLVEWHLESPRVIAAINNLTRDPTEAPALIHLPNPPTSVVAGLQAGSDVVAGLQTSAVEPQGESASPAAFSPIAPALPKRQSASPTAAPSNSPPAQSEPARRSETEGGPLIALQSRLRTEFTKWFSKGYAATSIRFTTSGADYCLSPYSDF